MTVPERRRRPTIQDVAREAGVSVGTVSNVINGRPVTRAETRERVGRAIQQLGYERNAAARALRTRKIPVIGLLIEDEAPRTLLTDPVQSALLAGMVERARYSDYAVVVTTCETDAVERQVRLLRDQGRVAGLLLLLQNRVDRRQFLLALGRRNFPVVVFDGPAGIDGTRLVSADHYGGARALCRHLIGLGHQRLAFIKGEMPWPCGDAREQGFVDQAREAQVQLQVFVARDWSSESAADVVQDLLRSSGATAVAAGNDVLALGILRAARALELSVPSDVSVTGFGDFVFAKDTLPPLTTAQFDPVSEGDAAAEMLIALAEGADSPGEVIVPTALVVRDSTGPPNTLARAHHA